MKIDHTANIKRIAKEKGIQLRDLAERLEITKETLSRLINGGNPTIKTLEKFANILDVDIKEILFGPEPAEPPTAKHICPHCQKEINIKINLE
jgi:transcriptional regulator with XRE-family HTH domain